MSIPRPRRMTMCKAMRQQWRFNKLISLQDKVISKTIRGAFKDWRVDREQSRTYRRMLKEEALRRYAQMRKPKHLRLKL